MDQESSDNRAMRRVASAQRWLAQKIPEVQRAGFYGELTVTLKFEDGQCVLGEQLVREKTK